MNNVREYELPCYDGRKLFYGKATVIEDKDVVKLRSYQTIVGYIKDNNFYRTWNGYSVMTMRHVNSFLIHFGLNKESKKWWDSLEVYNAKEVL